MIDRVVAVVTEHTKCGNAKLSFNSNVVKGGESV